MKKLFLFALALLTLGAMWKWSSWLFPIKNWGYPLILILALIVSWMGWKVYKIHQSKNRPPSEQVEAETRQSPAPSARRPQGSKMDKFYKFLGLMWKGLSSWKTLAAIGLVLAGYYIWTVKNTVPAPQIIQMVAPAIDPEDDMSPFVVSNTPVLKRIPRDKDGYGLTIKREGDLWIQKNGWTNFVFFPMVSNKNCLGDNIASLNFMSEGTNLVRVTLLFEKK